MHATRRVVAFGTSVVSLVLLTSGFPRDRAVAGIGFPCTLGHASPTGFQPCTACEPGTFAPIFGATSCDPCPDRTAATASAAFECTDCDCDDETACTLDSCEKGTGVCTAEPVASCEVVRVEFAGFVDSVVDFFPVTLDMPIAGSYDVDPLAPDHLPGDPDRGSYPTAASSVEVSVGDPAVFVATASVGSIDLSVTPDYNYFVNFSNIDVTTPTDGKGDFFTVSLIESNAFDDDDALLVAPPLATFDTTSLGISVLFGASFASLDFTLTTVPEPSAVTLACGATAGLIALARIRSRRTTRTRD